MEFRFYHPGTVIFKDNAIDMVGEYASKLGDNVMLVTGRRFARRYGYIDRIKGLLEESGLTVYVFDRVIPNPTFDNVREGVSEAKRRGIDVFVAFGGGSAMDAAKAISVVYSLGGDVQDYVYPTIVEDEIRPIIAMPTTAGTGSEVTKYSVLIDDSNVKTVIVGEPLIPKVALLDPSVLRHMSPELTGWTGFDALSHAFESYFGRRSNVLTELYSFKAIEIIFQHLPDAVRGDPNSREKVFYASMLAGFAINISGTNIAHGLGYYLTTDYNLHHGLANALILPWAVEFCSLVEPDKFQRLAKVVSFSTGRSVEDVSGLVESILRLMKECNIPTSLTELGIPFNDLDKMVEASHRYERNLSNSPRKPTLEEVKDIYIKAFKRSK